MDFKDTFFDDLKSAVRTASICDGSYLEVVDQIETKEGAPAKVRWTMVTPAKVSVTPDGIILSQGKVRMKLAVEGAEVRYCTWPSRPDAYDLPTKDFPAPAEKYASLCGFEFEVPAAASVKIVTTLKKLQDEREATFLVREIPGIMPPFCKQPAIFNSFSLL